ncbi:MAG: radical SAM protein [Planctomycetes bacterium]|nr:radical SAM protein [Planctomycetota bacterium]
MSPGLAALAPDLADAKARLARRLVLAGFTCDDAAFESRGLRLSDDDRAHLDGWLATSVRSEVVDEVHSRDGTVRMAIRLADDRGIETVVMPDDSVCVSTQVGCAVQCPFCASGLHGLSRNLTTAEILEQIVHARRLQPTVGRVVYMGVGEPSHNLSAVLEALDVLADDGGIQAARQTLSTVGSGRVPGALLGRRNRPNLAISMHTLDQELRRRLVPGSSLTVGELLERGDAYALHVGRPVQYAWTLLRGVNDSDADVAEWGRTFEGRAAYVNVIPWNPVAGIPFESPGIERAIEIVRRLRALGVLATVRRSAGADAEAACGQLRAMWADPAIAVRREA